MATPNIIIPQATPSQKKPGKTNVYTQSIVSSGNNNTLIYLNITVPQPDLAENSEFKLNAIYWNLPKCNLYYQERRIYSESIVKAFIKNMTFQQNNSRNIVVLSGNGGIGKTQLALHYAWQQREKLTPIYSLCRLVLSETEQGIEKEYRSFAVALGMNVGVPATIEELIAFVKRQLSKILQKTKALIIFDNVENSQALQPYLQSLYDLTNIHILITSRNAQPWHAFNPIIIDTYRDFEATSYICRVLINRNMSKSLLERSLSDYCETQKESMLNNSFNYEAANRDVRFSGIKQFSQKLEYYPLALTHALAYCVEENITLEEYCSNFDACMQEVIIGQVDYDNETLTSPHYFNETILDDDILGIRYGKSIYTAFKLTFNALQKKFEQKNKNSSIAKIILYILGAVAYLSSDFIPKKLLEYLIQKNCIFEKQTNIGIQREIRNVFKELQSYSLLIPSEFENNNTDYHIHRLTQAVIRFHWDKVLEKSSTNLTLFLTPDLQIEQLMEALLSVCFIAPAADEIDLIDKLQIKLQLHVDSVLDHQSKLQLPATLLSIQLKSIQGVVSFIQGSDLKALKIQEETLKELEQKFPKEVVLKEKLIVRQAHVLIELQQYLDAKAILDAPITPSDNTVVTISTIKQSLQQHSMSWKEAYADLLCHMHNQDEAVNYIANLLSMTNEVHAGLQYRLQYQLAKLYTETGKYTQAKELVENITSNSSSKNQWLLARGFILLAQLYLYLDNESVDVLCAGDKAIEYAESMYGKYHIRVAEIYAEYANILKNTLYQQRQAQIANTALLLLEHFCQNGVQKANYYLGLAYDREIFSEYDKTCSKQHAFKYYEEAAKFGNTPAQMYLAYLYCSKEEIVTHIPKYKRLLFSYEWMEKAAKTNFHAQFHLAHLIQHDEGPAKDWTREERVERIFSLLTKAAMSGLPEAQAWLGRCFLNNYLPNSIVFNEETKIERAQRWLSNAANQGHSDAKSLLALILYNDSGKVTDDLKQDVRLRCSTHFSAAMGYIDGLKSQYDIVDGFEPNTGYYPLHYAAEAGELETSLALINLGAEVDARNMARKTPLLLASEKAHFEIIKLLLTQRATVDAEDFYGLRSIFFATHQGRDNIFRVLVEAGADINYISPNKYNLLHNAVIGAHPDIIEILLNKGININAKTQDEYGNTALHIAAFSGLFEIYAQLIANGANRNIKNNLGYDCLHAASQSGNAKLVEFILKNAVDVNSETRDGRTALYFAASVGNLTIVQILINAGAKLTNNGGEDYIYLHASALGGNPELLQIALSKKIDINLKSKNGLTALHHAALSGQLRTFRVLRDKGADIIARDNRGWTCLHYAAVSGHPNIILDVLSANVDVNTKDLEGSCALHQAAGAGNLLAFKILLAKGADVDTVNNDNWNCLHYAMSGRHEDLIAYILKNRLVSQYAKTKSGESVESLALNRRFGGMHMLRLIVEYGLNEEESLDLQKISKTKHDCLQTLTERLAADHQMSKSSPALVSSLTANNSFTTASAEHSIPQEESVHQTMPGPVSIPSGLIYQAVPGDGHCLYRAVSLYLGLEPDYLRRIVAAHIEHNIQELEGFIDLPAGRNIEGYLSNIREGREWADHIDIEVLMRTTGRPIVVLGADGKIRDRTVLERFTGEPIFVYYNGHTHYDALLLETSRDPELARKIINQLTQFNERPHNNHYPATGVHQVLNQSLVITPPIPISGLIGQTLVGNFNPINSKSMDSESSSSTNLSHS